jgi:hypothetical protein
MEHLYYAAINLEKEAVRLTVLACGLDSADTSRILMKSLTHRFLDNAALHYISIYYFRYIWLNPV